MAFEDAPLPKKHLMPGMYEFNEQVVCRRRAAGGIPWHWNVGVASPPLPRRGVAMQMNDGAMQSFALTLDKLLEHAAKWHPRTEVVTGRADGGVDRASVCGARPAQPARCRWCCASFGVRGGDRVATLAWNTQAHVEVWYAIMGMGAVCHTLNPRLICAQLAAMVTQSGARVLIVSADLAPLARQIAEAARSIEILRDHRRIRRVPRRNIAGGPLVSTRSSH